MTIFSRFFLSTTLLLLLVPLHAQELGNPECSRLLLVSGFLNNNVKIFDACDGTFIRNLDDAGRLSGPQAIAVDPAGGLVVVSEDNGRLVRYHRDTLTYDRVLAGDRPETPQLEPNPIGAPTGLSISDDGSLLVGSFSQHRISKVDPNTGAVITDLISPNGSGLQGPDAGMLLEGNRLWVPGFDSSTIVSVDINQPGSDTLVVPAGSNGMNAPRTILRSPSGNLLIASWRGNQIMEFNSDTGAFVRVVTNSVTRPTGMDFESEDILLVASSSTHDISRIRLSDGQLVDKLVLAGAGGLNSPTYVLVLDKKSPDLPLNNGFWVIGVGEVQGHTIRAENMIFTTGGGFGALLMPENIQEVTWGSVELSFDSCNSGRMDYDSVQAGFGVDGYGVIRLAPGPSGAICEEAGFENVLDPLWMSGIWYGGASRNGEGLSVNILDNNSAVVTWYTYLP